VSVARTTAAQDPPGYAHPAYAAAVADGRPTLRLPGSGGWLVERAVPGVDARDAVGPYPLFACGYWDRLDADLRALPADLVSVTLVADPFGDHTPALLARVFPDRCVAYKEHMVADLARPTDAIVSAHHRRNVRRAARAVEVEVVATPMALRETWVSLYATLVRRHAIAGPAAFSPSSLAAQLAVPGIVALRATRGGETVGMTLWYERPDVAYYHLGAYSPAGYDLRAAYALFAAALDHFRGRARWLALGAGAGVDASDDDGLTRFKRGWATGTRTAWLCGRILDRQRYGTLAGARASDADVAAAYFPVYRAPVVARDAT